MSEVYRIHKTGNYTVLSNYHLRDMSISLKAKGLLSVIFSLPDGWGFSVRGLASICKDGKAAVASALNELIGAGYIYRFQANEEGGHFGKVVYEIFETPDQAKEFFQSKGSTAESLENKGISPRPKNQDTGENTASGPHPGFRDTVESAENSAFSPSPGFQDTGNRSSELLNTNNNKINNIAFSARARGASLQGVNAGNSGTQENSTNLRCDVMGDITADHTFLSDSRTAPEEEKGIARDAGVPVSFYDISEEVPMSISPGVYDAVVRYTENPSLRMELFHYAEMCAANRRALTGYAISMLLEKLGTLGHSDQEKVEIVRAATLHRWWEFYPLNKEEKPEKPEKPHTARKASEPLAMSGNYDIAEIERNLLSNAPKRGDT